MCPTNFPFALKLLMNTGKLFFLNLHLYLIPNEQLGSSLCFCFIILFNKSVDLLSLLDHVITKNIIISSY